MRSKRASKQFCLHVPRKLWSFANITAMVRILLHESCSSDAAKLIFDKINKRWWWRWPKNIVNKIMIDHDGIGSTITSLKYWSTTHTNFAFLSFTEREVMIRRRGWGGRDGEEGEDKKEMCQREVQGKACTFHHRFTRTHTHMMHAGTYIHTYIHTNIHTNKGCTLGISYLMSGWVDYSNPDPN